MPSIRSLWLDTESVFSWLFYLLEGYTVVAVFNCSMSKSISILLDQSPLIAVALVACVYQSETNPLHFLCRTEKVEHFGKFVSQMDDTCTKMFQKFDDHCNKMSGRKWTMLSPPSCDAIFSMQPLWGSGRECQQ